MSPDKHDINAIFTAKSQLRDKRNAAVIIARGRSRRLPFKNVLPFCGHPLVSWCIIQAKMSHLITDVYLSTDDDEIAEVGEKYGAAIIRRSHELAELTGTASFAHAILEIKHPIDLFLAIMPTAPVRPPWDFDEAIMLYNWLENQYGLNYQLCPLVPQLETVIYKKLGENHAELCIQNKNWEYVHLSGSWTIQPPARYMRTWSEMPTEQDDKLDKLYSKPENDPNRRMYFYPIETWQSVDIDLWEHFELAELMMNHYVTKGNGMQTYHKYGEAE